LWERHLAAKSGLEASPTTATLRCGAGRVEDAAMKLKIIRGVQNEQGEQAIKEHLLKAGRESIIGRSTRGKTWMPEIDLWPDDSVSRKHARMVFKGSAWSIVDLGSKNGTRVGDVKLGKGDPAAVVLPGMPIEIGKTILVVDPIERHRFSWRNLSIAFDFPAAINYSLFHCGIPTLRNISVLNWGDGPSQLFSLRFQVPGYSEAYNLKVPPIGAGKSHTCEDAPFKLLQDRLEELRERKKARIEVQADREAIYETPVWMLGFYEWSWDIGHHKTLAAFVQPANPVVQNIIRHAELHLKKIAGTASFTDLLEGPDASAAELALKALYECLRSSYHLKYVAPPVSYELKSQVIRPPHRIITGWKEEKISGSGTCADLTLLLAACLESLALKPLIIVVKQNDWARHAFIGCWKQDSAIREAVLSYEQLKSALEQKEVILLECMGFAEDQGKKLTYSQAVKAALGEISSKKFLYALNLVQLRDAPDGKIGKITPIQNQASPEVLGIIRRSKDIARSEENRQVHTVHLLYGFLTSGSKIAADVFKVTQCEDLLKKDVNKAQRPFGSFPKKSMNFKIIIDIARDLANRNGYGCIEEHHLLWALLNCGSDHLKTKLKKCGFDIVELQRTLDRVLQEKEIDIRPRDDSHWSKE
jgi:hypothetical protein